MWDFEHSGAYILLKCFWVISCALVRNHQSLEEAWKERPIWYIYIIYTHTYTQWFCHQIAVHRPDLCIAQSCDKNTHTVGSRKFMISWHWYKSLTNIRLHLHCSKKLWNIYKHESLFLIKRHIGTIKYISVWRRVSFCNTWKKSTSLNLKSVICIVEGNWGVGETNSSAMLSHLVSLEPSQKTKIIVLIGVITNSHNPIHWGFVLPCSACLSVNNWWFLS